MKGNINTELLKRTIKYHGWTQQQLADEMDISRQAMQNWFRQKNMRVSDAEKLIRTVPLTTEETMEIFFNIR